MNITSVILLVNGLGVMSVPVVSMAPGPRISSLTHCLDEMQVLCKL